MLTLARALVDYDFDLLQAIAAQWDLDLTSSDRGLAAEELAAAMLDPKAAYSTWERLGEEAQEALSDLLANDGRLPFAHFARRYGEIRPMGPARRERERPWAAPASITELLFYRGLIVRAFEQSSAGEPPPAGADHDGQSTRLPGRPTTPSARREVRRPGRPRHSASLPADPRGERPHLDQHLAL
jgi:hypothetical protein